VDEPLNVNQNGIGVHVVVLVIGGNRIAQGNVLQYTVFSGVVQNVVIIYIVPFTPPSSSSLSTAPGVYLLLRLNAGGTSNGTRKENPTGITISLVNTVPAGIVLP
jgi:hypothetical protein